GHLVLRLEDPAQELRGLFEYDEKLGVDVSELRRRGDTQNTWINVAWTRAKQQSVRGIDFGNCGFVSLTLPHYQLCHEIPLPVGTRSIASSTQRRACASPDNKDPGHSSFLAACLSKGSQSDLFCGCVCFKQVLQLVCLIDCDQVVDKFV